MKPPTSFSQSPDSFVKSCSQAHHVNFMSAFTSAVCNLQSRRVTFHLMFTALAPLPATMAHCQQWETFLEEAPCRFTTFGKMPKIVGTLPKVPHLTLTGPDQTYTKLLSPKLAPKRHIFLPIPIVKVQSGPTYLPTVLMLQACTNGRTNRKLGIIYRLAPSQYNVGLHRIRIP